MRRKLTKNLGLKILSLLVAFLIWLLVANVNNPVKSKLFRDVKIQIVNENSVTEIDKTFDIVSEDSVTIKVTERRKVLDGLSSDDFTVIADMENLTEMNTVPLTVTCSDPSVTLDEMTMVPSSMKVELEQIVQNDFVVTVETTGSPMDGYEVGTTEVLEGKGVQIAGPESLLDRIGQVTAAINVNNISSDRRMTSELSITDKNGDALSETQMSRLQIKDSNGVLLADNEVTVDVTLWRVLNDVAIEIETAGTPRSGYEVTEISVLPAAVSLAGPDDILDQIGDSIVLNTPVSVEDASETFTEEVDLSETLDSIEVIRLAQNMDPVITVTVQVEKSNSETFQIPLSNLEVKNRPENMILTFSPADAISVTVQMEEEGQLISESEILAGIDLSVCREPGDYEIPVEIELPEGCSLTSEVVLMVNSSKPEQIEAATEE